jgi:hypothetical protein
VSPQKAILRVFIPMRDGRRQRHPEACGKFAEAQDAFKRHTGVEWMDSFCAFQGCGGFHPGEIPEGPIRGSKILPARFRSHAAALREAA